MDKVIKCAFYLLTRSGTLAESCAFRKEGIIRNDFMKYDKTLSDVVYYGMTAQDFYASVQHE